MGSEFSYEDLGSQDIENLILNLSPMNPLRAEKRGEWREKSKKRSGYSKQIMIVHQEYLSPTTIEYYDRRGGLLKVAEFSDWKQMKAGGKSFWKSGYVHVKNIQTKKESIFKWEKRELGKKLDASLFSPSALDKGINDEISFRSINFFERTGEYFGYISIDQRFFDNDGVESSNDRGFAISTNLRSKFSWKKMDFLGT